MQRLFPEGDYFTHVLYGLAWTNLAEVDTAYRAEAIREASWAVQHLEQQASKAIFPETQSPPHGAFYVGWLAWLRGRTLLITPPAQRAAADTAALRVLCDQLAAAFRERTFPTSYPGSSWTPDGATGVAALATYDRLFGARYAEVIAQWIAESDARRLPPDSLLPHALDGPTQEMDFGAIHGPRGSSSVAIARSFAELDARRAQQEWARAKKAFLTTRLGLLGIAEYPAGTRDADGDVDSGPLIFGVSASATVYAIGAARAAGDTATADRLDRVAEALGLGFTWRGQRRYLLGALPVGDAFLVWARTTPMGNPGGGAGR